MHSPFTSNVHTVGRACTSDPLPKLLVLKARGVPMCQPVGLARVANARLDIASANWPLVGLVPARKAGAASGIGGRKFILETSILSKDVFFVV